MYKEVYDEMQFISVKSQFEYQAISSSEQMNEIATLSKSLSDSLPQSSERENIGRFEGYCDVCKCTKTFSFDWRYTVTSVNFRERLECPACKLNNRQRAMFSFLTRTLKNLDKPTVYCYEQVTPFFNALSSRLSRNNIKVIGSEFLGYNYASGDVVNGIRHEDALNLSFPDSSIDVIISNDVFEHVPDIGRTLIESKRVLKSNGMLIFTIPFTHQPFTKKRSDLVNGEIYYLEPAVYHGNPVSENGSLVFYDFGWDVFSLFQSYGFELTMHVFTNIKFGHLSYFPLFLFSATVSKKAEACE